MKEKRIYKSLSYLLGCLLLMGAAGVLLQVSACSFYQSSHVEDFVYLDNDLTAEGTIANDEVNQYMDMGELEGFAAMPGEGLNTTTGGMDGEVVIVENTVELANAIKGDIPRIVVVKGQIVSMLSNDDMDLNQANNLSDNMAVKGRGGYGLSIGSNRTIVGYDENAELYGRNPE